MCEGDTAKDRTFSAVYEKITIPVNARRLCLRSKTPGRSYVNIITAEKMRQKVQFGRGKIRDIMSDRKVMCGRGGQQSALKTPSYSLPHSAMASTPGVLPARPCSASPLPVHCWKFHPGPVRCSGTLHPS